MNVWDPADGRCLSAALGPLLNGAAATAASVLPGGLHAALGGQALSVWLVELASMGARPLVRTTDWTLALACVESPADGVPLGGV